MWLRPTRGQRCSTAGSAAAGRLVASFATLAIVTGNPQWLRPLVLHAVAASEWATREMRQRADSRLPLYRLR